MLVYKLGDQMELLATNTIKDEVFISSPAIVGGEMYLRGQKAVYCIRTKK